MSKESEPVNITDKSILPAFSGENLSLLEDLYASYRKDTLSVDSEWRALFSAYESNRDSFSLSGSPVVSQTVAPTGTLELSRVELLLNTYRNYGHYAAGIDPLGMRMPERTWLKKSIESFSPEELKKSVTHVAFGTSSLEKLISMFERIYCDTIGLEISHLDKQAEKSWFYKQVESDSFFSVPETSIQKQIFLDLIKAEYFEKFSGNKFPGKKRFSLEGGESLIVLLNSLLREAEFSSAEGVVLGMAHRGRLNVLANVLEKPLSKIFAEFNENFDPATPDYSDVKYHLGYSAIRKLSETKNLKVTLMFNPSHLEAVHPVVNGSVRARQTLAKDTLRNKYYGIVIHGDAAFAGQGVVAEALNLSKVEGFSTGGTIHIVLNNQIGFTTDPSDSRGGPHATDPARGYHVPVIHVNGDDAEAVYKAALLAIRYRHTFHKDIVIDLVVYRKLGHNETDEPSFTQPFLYKIIKKHPGALAGYEKILKERGNSDEFITLAKEKYQKELKNGLHDQREQDVKMEVDTMKGNWSSIHNSNKISVIPSKMELKELGRTLVQFPDGFKLHPKLERYYTTREQMVQEKKPLDWAAAESLALAGLLKDKFWVRFSGQDVSRGTFSHRHAVLADYNTGTKFSPFENITERGVEFVNSPLSEFAVLGYEFGYSLVDPYGLVIWEAQFGDFANGAQVIFDQFISSAEQKWHRKSALTMLLPHGYEGQGPEHSSARLERFLQMASQENMRIVNLTTPAQYFHALRRQMVLHDRKPLLVFTPKSLLRYTESFSELKDFYNDGFLPVIWDRLLNPKRVIFCSGKIYYDIQKVRDEKNLVHVSLVRVEQLYPFPEVELKQVINQYSNATEFVWAQEEPENMGANSYIRDQLIKLIPERAGLSVVSRPSSAVPAEGIYKLHEKEQNRIVKESLGVRV
ncbi:MAG: 2-oxoglutarate dehydrogenase E1 component [Leptospirales bacterium]